MMRKVVVVFTLLTFHLFGWAQVTSIPAEAKANFAQQYPEAKNIKWSNDIVNVNVKFEMEGEKYNAEYNNKGIWRQTFKNFSFDKLPSSVQDGFQKSRYSDRTVSEVKLVYYPGNVEQYRLKVEKNDLQKKYLFFNAGGRLVRESVTF